MWTRALCLLALIVPGAAPAKAQDAAAAKSTQDAPATTDRPSKDEVVVVTASRREEQLLNAPATMTVITEQEIATAAASTVPDLLRLVPGVNVARTSVRDVNVNTRAATGTLSDSMLVLLDGRSIYQDFFGFVMWDFLPVDVGEIKQVEVIRGPVPRQYRGRVIIIDVGVAARQSTGDARRLPDGRCGPITLVDA